MIINEIEGITETEVDPEIIYNKIRAFCNWLDVATDQIAPDLLNAHKEVLWHEIDSFQKILKNSNLLTVQKVKNLETIKSKIWIK